MSHCKRLPEFEKEFARLLKKYPTLEQDFSVMERVLAETPTGIGSNFTILHSSTELRIIKGRLMCRSLRKRSLRVIYAYHQNVIEFVYIEIYFKGNKENEDRERIREYLKKYAP